MKTKLLLLTLLIFGIANSQEQITFGIYQDVKLGLGMDKEHGNKSSTMDLIAVVNMEGNQFDYYYFAIQMLYERANLSSGYFSRYGVNTMWYLNTLILEDLNLGFGFGGHVIERKDTGGLLSYSVTVEASYPLFQWLDIGIKNEWLKRPDLENKKIGYNLSLGIIVKPFNN